MNLRDIKIDKTAKIEEMLQEHLVICLNGMPGSGKKTAVRMLLEKHPEVNPVFCSVDEIEDATALQYADKDRVNWYLLHKPEKCIYPETDEGLWRFIHLMPRQDRIFLVADGLIPDSILTFVWNGVMGVVMPETFRFTETETYRYLKCSGSALRYRDVYYLTGGYAGCAAMLVRMEKQLGGGWTAWELCVRYEIRRYIQMEILSKIPEEDLRILEERAAFPYLNEELVSVLWTDPAREAEERLFLRGAMIYIPEKACWYVHPALRLAVEKSASPELCRKATSWYEGQGNIQAALMCCWYLRDRKLYRECLIRNYDKVPFLNYEKIGWTGEEIQEDLPEILYLEWMENMLRGDFGRLEDMRLRVENLAGRIRDEEPEKDKMAEIFLNITYTDPDISAEEWMEILREYSEPEHPVRLYFMLGESVSYLSGLRDLSELFACSRKKRKEYKELWEERLAPVNQTAYRLAELEYEIQTDAASVRKRDGLGMLPETDESTPWQLRLGRMYIAYLAMDNDGYSYRMKRFITETADSLEKESAYVCRWNARALLYLSKAKWGEKEDLIRWIRETGGDIGNEYGKTKFYMAAEAKIALYLGNYARAESLLSILIPLFSARHSWRWLAEALFQRAVAEWAGGERVLAVKTTAESMVAANPYRYVKLYTGYGKAGAALLKEYRSWLDKTDSLGYQRKKKYKYGDVRNMPVADWLDYIIRRADKEKKSYVDLQSDQQNIYRIEKLTVTEQLVLQYLAKGYANAEISSAMNIKLPTVKSHIYNIYKKLGVTARVQAVERAKETGLL